MHCFSEIVSACVKSSYILAISSMCDSDHPHPELSAKASVSLVLIIKTKFEETGST